MGQNLNLNETVMKLLIQLTMTGCKVVFIYIILSRVKKIYYHIVIVRKCNPAL